MTSVTRSCETDRETVLVQNVIKKHAEDCSQVEMRYLYLQGWLAVGHCGWALSTDDDRHMEAVVGESGGSTCHTEGLSQRFPGFLAEDRVHQLDDLVLRGERLFYQFQREKHIQRKAKT